MKNIRNAALEVLRKTLIVQNKKGIEQMSGLTNQIQERPSSTLKRTDVKKLEKDSPNKSHS